VLNLEKKKEKKTYGDQGKGIAYGFGFGAQDTIEDVITFRIDSYTIKREILRLSGVIIDVYALRT